MKIESTLLQMQRGEKYICQGLYVRAEGGTITGILGPAGAGKSVFLSLLAGYEKPDSGGQIRFGGPDVDRCDTPCQEVLGYVPQAEIMLPNLTVYDSLDFAIQLRYPDREPAYRKTLIHNMCRHLGFSKKSARYCSPRRSERPSRVRITLVEASDGA